MVEMPGDITSYQLTVPQGRFTPSIGFGTVVQHSVGPSVYFAELTWLGEVVLDETFKKDED